MKAKIIVTTSILCLTIIISCQQNPYKEGERLYDAYCGNCHMPDGKGLKSLCPPLAQSDYLAQNQTLIPCIITQGIEGSIIVNGKEYNQPMEGIKGLTAVQITNIINYINHAWGNDAGYTKIQEVEAALQKCK